jgi:RimJ/RimL family protein N-acetyltransferase
MLGTTGPGEVPMRDAALVHRLRRALQRYGLAGAARAAWARIWGRIALSEAHIWYELDPRGARPRPSLLPSLTLRRGVEADLRLLDELPTVSPVEGRARQRDGNDLWLVLEGERPLFSCWIFRQRTPAVAAPGGELRLVEGMVCLEDSVTAASARGRGIAVAAWSAIADTLAQEGQRRLITKVAVENGPSRRAVEKAGFAAVAVVRFRRIGFRAQTRVQVLDGNRGRFFAESLEAPW